MTGQDRPQMLARADSDESVVRYLEENPQFLLHHPQLLRSLHVPHECGGDAVSLIEAQVQALRVRNAQLHEHLATLETFIQQFGDVMTSEEVLAVLRNKPNVSDAVTID